MLMMCGFLSTRSSRAVPENKEATPAGSCAAVSVVVPAYNYASYLSDCLESVLRQPGIKAELIVVDDGSTDDTRRVVDTFGERIRYVYQDNAGLSSARNTGLRFATGKYILFLDADDVLGDDTLEPRVRFLDQNPSVDIAMCRSRFLGAKGWLPWQKEWLRSDRDIFSHLLVSNLGPPHAFLIRKRVVEQIGWFDLSLRACEDYDYWFRAATAGFCIRPSPGYVYYRKHTLSMSANMERQLAYDVVLHGKVLTWLTGQTGVELFHWISYVAGLLVTVAKGRYFRVPLDTGPLVEGALLLATDQKCFSRCSVLQENLDTYLSLLNHIEQLAGSRTASLQKLRRSVWDTILFHRLPSNRRAFLKFSASLCGGDPLYCLSACRLRINIMLAKRIVVGCDASWRNAGTVFCSL